MAGNMLRNIVIVGGGTAGWMTAAALSNVLGDRYRIRLVESDEIATIGVGEATIPLIKDFNVALEIDENEFLRQTQGTYKLGIEFVNWGQIGDSYIHGFGKIGHDLGLIPCYQYWLKMHQAGEASDLGNYSINTLAPRKSKYLRSEPEMAGSPLGDIANAFHIDASLYAKFLRRYAEARGVLRTEGRIVQTVLREADGFIDCVVLANGEKISGDFFIDCSGTRALLIGDALKREYEDWSHWLPCDRAIAVPCESVAPLLPYTRSTAHSAGWQWRIPLQHRIGNGHVYSSRFMSQDEATAILLSKLDGKQLAEPRYIPFVPGRRKQTWHKNCVAVGLSSGFFEPIESTNIHLIQSAIARVIRLFPAIGFEQADIDEYNAQTQFEYERIRDFIILHYKATQRDDSPFWKHCRAMEIPATLQHRMDLFSSNGRVYREGSELFGEVSWVQVMHGQGIRPKGYNPLVDLRPREEIRAYLGNIESVIGKCVDVMPTHAEFIAKNCAATG
ncbi:MAG: tryptophan 7-halogenase [Rhodoferax sp.]|uniref:tryptophan halogenase family protein n=1 Tax=Rhodoferax sp. TaxID=50421 RepID=UPI0026119E3C|nr:tryptophan halogenase family protein [Rhodoferax sp.]MDD5332179.1 tryptophan 7-halogenase [Rhodoferax sp.]